MKKRYWILLIIILAIAAFLIFKKRSSEYGQSYVVQEQDVSDELLLAGTIDAQKRVDLGFASAGRVKKVTIKEGDIVKRGQVIAEIEQNRLAADLTQAQANLAVVRSDTVSDTQSVRDSLEKQTQQQNELVDNAYQLYLSGDLRAYNTEEADDTRRIAPTITGSYLGDTEGEYVLDFYRSSAPSGYSFKLSGLEFGTFTAEDSQAGKLGTQGLYIQIDSDTNYNDTQWVIPVPNTRSTSYISRKNTYETTLVTRTTVISELANNVNRVNGSRTQALTNQARAQVNAVAAQLGDGKITAPFDGIVVKNNLEVGEIASAFTPVVTLFQDNTKKLTINVPEIYINKIQIGDMVSVELDAYPEEFFAGTVTDIDIIDTEVDGVPVYETDIVLTDTNDERIRIGMNAKARIIADQRLGVVAIPKHYITQNTDGASTVLVQTNLRPIEVEEKTVTTGYTGNDGLVEITSGLSAGDTLVLNQN